MYLLSFLTTVFNQFLIIHIIIKNTVPNFQSSSPINTNRKERDETANLTKVFRSFLSPVTSFSASPMRASSDVASFLIIQIIIPPSYTGHAGYKKKSKANRRQNEERERERTFQKRARPEKCGGQNSRYLMAT